MHASHPHSIPNNIRVQTHHGFTQKFSFLSIDPVAESVPESALATGNFRRRIEASLKLCLENDAINRQRGSAVRYRGCSCFDGDGSRADQRDLNIEQG